MVQVKALERGRDPSWRMNTIRYIGDRDLLGRFKTGKHFEPELFGNLAVFFTHAVCRTAHPKSERGHSKKLGFVCWVRPAQCEKFIGRYFERSQKFATETVKQSSRLESVVTGIDRSMRRKNTVFSYRTYRFGKAGILIRCQILTCKFQSEKGGMTFIQMINRG